MASLSSKLLLIETAANDVVQNTKLRSNDLRAAQNLNSAAIVLDWTRFAIPVVVELERIAPEFDFQQVKANGYRSLLAIVTYCVDSIMQRVQSKRFRAISVSELRALAQSCEMALLGLVMRELSTRFNVNSDHRAESEQSHTVLLPHTNTVAHDCYQQIATKCNAEVDARQFVLASITFGYSLPLQYVLRLMSAAFVAMHDARVESRAFLNSTLETDSNDTPQEVKNLVLRVAGAVHQYVQVVKSLLQTLTLTLPIASIDRLRVERAAAVAYCCDARFVQRCWNLPELPLIHFGEMLTAPSVGHVELLRLHFSNFSVPLRIVCPFAVNRHAQCAKLLVHAHGGGFVAHTSKSHEPYLRRIALQLGVPIISIDYSTAPQTRFPQPVDECYAVYKFILQCDMQSQSQSRDLECDALNRVTLKRLRECSTCEDIVFLGDSAGGNLLLSVVQRAILDGVRLPRAFVGVYTPMVLQFAPSPSRMMTLIDPLVPGRTFAACLLAYFGRELGPTLEHLERDCARHSQADSQQSIDVDVHLCAECSQIRVAGRLATDWLCQVNRLRAQLFRDVLPAGCSRSQHLRASCALAKLQSFTAAANHAVSTLQVHAGTSVPCEQELPTSAPLYWSDAVLKQLPHIALLVPSVLDPTIDDNVQFSRRLAALGKSVTLDAIDSVPHGFFNFANLCPNSSRGLILCITRLREAFLGESC